VRSGAGSNLGGIIPAAEGVDLNLRRVCLDTPGRLSESPERRFDARERWFDGQECRFDVPLLLHYSFYAVFAGFAILSIL
jgi:hypothetical protein